MKLKCDIIFLENESEGLRMRANDKKIRNSLKYKIKMWFYRLTFRDVKKGIKIFYETVFEIIILILSFLLLFIIPAFFH